MSRTRATPLAQSIMGVVRKLLSTPASAIMVVFLQLLGVAGQEHAARARQGDAAGPKLQESAYRSGIEG
ncbi:hypothetical protein VZT92_017069 [Zoarces viviparus]|uniref:Uncharacterized protein n=1 Tax=Zoarces viviparus TaxID=48416 RepID=A0AAW1EQ39_ZOAVI